MSKYHRLREFLAERDQDHIPMTFEEIEKVLEFSLPASKRYPAWWSNNPSNNPMTQEWLNAGYETASVNTGGEKLVFRKVRSSSKADHSSGGEPSNPRPRHPGFGFMAGQIKFAEGFDGTGPYDDEPWDQGYLGEDQLDER